MSRRKKPKVDKKPTVELPDSSPTINKQELTKRNIEYNIQLIPIVMNREDGIFENVHLFEQLLPILEETSTVFGDDSMPRIENYKEWLQYHLDFVEQLAPWIFAVVVDGNALGFCWAINWAGNGAGIHSVQISGAMKRKSPVDATTQGLKKLVSMIFDNTPVYIIRGGYTEDNRAAGFALGRAGFSHPEKERATMIREGQEITGIIKSITRPEWEEMYG